MFFGTKFYNDLLMEAGPSGNVQSEVLLQKDQKTFTFKQGWAFPRKVYFNGDECMLPPPDSYPFLPNSARGSLASLSTLSLTILVLVLISVGWFDVILVGFQKQDQKMFLYETMFLDVCKLNHCHWCNGSVLVDRDSKNCRFCYYSCESETLTENEGYNSQNTFSIGPR